MRLHPHREAYTGLRPLPSGGRREHRLRAGHPRAFSGRPTGPGRGGAGPTVPVESGRWRWRWSAGEAAAAGAPGGLEAPASRLGPPPPRGRSWCGGRSGVLSGRAVQGASTKSASGATTGVLPQSAGTEPRRGPMWGSPILQGGPRAAEPSDLCGWHPAGEELAALQTGAGWAQQRAAQAGVQGISCERAIRRAGTRSGGVGSGKDRLVFRSEPAPSDAHPLQRSGRSRGPPTQVREQVRSRSGFRASCPFQSARPSSLNPRISASRRGLALCPDDLTGSPHTKFLTLPPLGIALPSRHHRPAVDSQYTLSVGPTCSCIRQ